MSEITFDWKPGIEEVCQKLKGKKRIGYAYMYIDAYSMLPPP